MRTGELESELSERSDADPALRRYKISDDGTDAILMFGRHKGLRVSDVDKKDPAYLNWILTDNFKSDLKEVVRYVQAQRLRRRDVAEMGKATRDLERSAKRAEREARKR